MNINLNKRFLLLLGKALVLLLTLYLLYQAIFTAPDTFLTWGSILEAAYSSSCRYLVVLVALLIPVNWGLEALKWQLLGNKLEPLSFKRAYRAVMVGLTLGFITPNRLGDYAGRVLELRSRERLEAIGAVFMGRFCQLVITMLAGTLALLYFMLRFYFDTYTGACVSVLALLLVLNALLLLLLYNPTAIVAVAATIQPLRRFVQYIKIMGRYSAGEINGALLLSLSRYAVFLLQFVLLLALFSVELSVQEYVSGVAGTFLLKSVVPSVSLLSDLGVRELSAMYLFGLLGQERLQVLSASLCLWLLNIVVPSVVGLYFVLQLRLKQKGVVAA